MDYFNQKRRRRAEFITPPNTLKIKIGSGGLEEDILARAEEKLKDNTADFPEIAAPFLAQLRDGIEKAGREGPNIKDERVFEALLYPVMELKANGAMFNYTAITELAARLIRFLEVITRLDQKALRIIQAFHDSMYLIIVKKLSGESTEETETLIRALNEACRHYFEAD